MNVSYKEHRHLFRLALIAGLTTLMWLGWLAWQSTQGDVLTVSGISMQPTLNPGDKVRFIADTQNPYKQGDLVAVKFKTRERMMVKRVIAVAGDEVHWRNEQVFVNNKPLRIDGWTADRRVPQRSWKLLGIQLKNYGNRVPDKNIIVMGDNTRKSYDSGDFGMLSLSQINGLIKP